MKNRVEQYSHNNSFGINFGATLSFGITPGLINGMMSMPVVRKVSSSFVRENSSCGAPGAWGAFSRQAFVSQSGIYAKENHISIGKTIEMTPTLRNEEKISIFDTAPISSIGSIMADAHEIEENLAAIKEHHHNDIIIDTEPVENEVITEASKEEKPVIAVDADPKKPEKQAVKEPDYTIHEADTRELLDEIYDTDIAPYHEFERAQSPTFSRPGSPVSDLDYFGIAQNFVKAVVESAVEFGAELVTPGGVENYQKFKAGKISALEYTNLVAQDMAKDATAAAIGAQIGGGLGGAAGFAMAGGCSIPGAVAGSTAGAAIGTAISRAGTAISRTFNKDKHESTVLMNENHSKSACGGKTEKVVQEKTYKGGAYDSIKVKDRPHNIERHHIPADSVSGVPRGKGMAIQMESEDHALTSSYRNSSNARMYREMIKRKIDNGEVRKAIAIEILDIRRSCGTKYNEAILQMLDYGYLEGLITTKK